MREALSSKIDSFAASLSPDELSVFTEPASLRFTDKVQRFQKDLNPTEIALFHAIHADLTREKPLPLSSHCCNCVHDDDDDDEGQSLCRTCDGTSHYKTRPFWSGGEDQRPKS